MPARLGEGNDLGIIPRGPPDEWARANRVYAEPSGLPGPRDPSITPYIVPVERAVHAGGPKRVVMVCGAQMGKALALDTPFTQFGVEVFPARTE